MTPLIKISNVKVLKATPWVLEIETTAKQLYRYDRKTRYLHILQKAFFGTGVVWKEVKSAHEVAQVLAPLSKQIPLIYRRKDYEGHYITDYG